MKALLLRGLTKRWSQGVREQLVVPTVPCGAIGLLWAPVFARYVRGDIERSGGWPLGARLLSRCMVFAINHTRVASQGQYVEELLEALACFSSSSCRFVKLSPRQESFTG